MAPTIISVVYPVGGKFDMDYYLSTHMPLVTEKWTPFGLKGWKVAQYSNADAPYQVQAWLEFESPDAWAKASGGAEGKVVFGDVSKFSEKAPILLTGELKDSKTT